MEHHNAYDLHLAAPRLSRALPAWFDHAGLIPATPALERMLARADRLGSPLATAALEAPLAFFGPTLREGTQPPWAALALAGGDERSAGRMLAAYRSRASASRYGAAAAFLLLPTFP
ncbi:MAG: hypothetical protein HND59_12275 [Pseudomonadota bacterium]|nr:MAG: hypothetical protein HND59_12275 [Pseudomonadota bacterium]